MGGSFLYGRLRAVSIRLQGQKWAVDATDTVQERTRGGQAGQSQSGLFGVRFGFGDVTGVPSGWGSFGMYRPGWDLYRLFCAQKRVCDVGAKLGTLRGRKKICR